MHVGDPFVQLGIIMGLQLSCQQLGLIPVSCYVPSIEPGPEDYARKPNSTVKSNLLLLDALGYKVRKRPLKHRRKNSRLKRIK